MKISASVYSNKDRSLDDLVKELDRYKVDYFHIDCNDNPAVFEDIKRIRAISKTPIDLHIISDSPEKFYKGIEETKVEMVCFQAENLKKEFGALPKLPSKVGLAIVSETPFEKYSELHSGLDFVLFMATSPGKSGGVFNKSNFSKIRKFKSMFPHLKIHVDGGVNDEVSFVLRNMGVSLVVSGSYLVNADYIGAAIHQLRSDKVESHISVKDFMITQEELPVLKSGKFIFAEVLQSIEKYNFGFTMVMQENGVLEGIISNADVRKALLKSSADFNKVDVQQMVNTNPVKVYEDSTVSEMLQVVKSKNFPILYMPVVDRLNRLAGALVFNNLIKGES